MTWYFFLVLLERTARRMHLPSVLKTNLSCMQLADISPANSPREFTGMARPNAAVSLLLPGSKLASFELAGSNSSCCCGRGSCTASSGATECCHLLAARESKPANQLRMARAERL